MTASHTTSPPNSAPGPVAVIGGGWAGCAAALELARHGLEVALFEQAQQLGGRARQLRLASEHEGHGVLLDNGQHIMLGAYRQCLELIAYCGLDVSQVLLTLPLQMPYPQTTGPDQVLTGEETGMHFLAPRLPAPLHLLIALLRAKGLSWADKYALASFSLRAQAKGWRLAQDCSVSQLLKDFRQTDNLIRQMWRPLCLAALNTPLERASAQVFLHVLRDSLGASRAASDMLLPRADLSSLFPIAAADKIRSLGGAVFCQTSIQSLHADAGAWRLQARAGKQESYSAALEKSYRAVIIATPPKPAASFLQTLQIPSTKQALLAALCSQLQQFEYEVISTCYLQYAPNVRLQRPFFALLDQPEKQLWGQFVFDRGQLFADQAGLLAVVISAAEQASGIERAHMAVHIATQLAMALQMPELAKPRWSQVISEKRATFACNFGLQRPAGQTPIDNIVLAGDYTAGDYPATLEAAVRSGVAAAQLILRGQTARA